MILSDLHVYLYMPTLKNKLRFKKKGFEVPWVRP
jgi:hypothetical protein